PGTWPSTPPEIDLSIVVPMYDEADNVLPLYESVTAAMRKLGRSYEVILVDDGSTDDTYARAVSLAEAYPRIKLVKLRRNFGQTAAMSAGFDFAAGAVIVPMDGDLQNDPADISLLLEQIEAGYDVVSGWRHDRNDNVARRVPSKTANWLIGRVTGVR